EELVSFIQDKNYLGEEELLNSMHIDKHIKDVLLAMPQLFGSADVLHKAKELTDNSECLAAIERLEKLYELLKVTGYDKYISFDLGAISKHTYYTGIIFYAYTFGTGEPVISGGRYDKLIGQFGCDKASIGFSITVDSLMAAINRQNLDMPVDANGTLVIYEPDNLLMAIKTSDELRKMNIPVALIRANDSKSTAQYCEYAESSQLEDIVFLNDTKDLDADVKVMKAKSATFRNCTLKKIWGGNF
ncbi:MAG: ATP phosphoribosyltransferase regulatory subunit, partial [Eubacteriales bacterium]|nr:ATP phosphoribosyltransferase regulatory subunit [Eubacteriales bacterium]